MVNKNDDRTAPEDVDEAEATEKHLAAEKTFFSVGGHPEDVNTFMKKVTETSLPYKLPDKVKKTAIAKPRLPRLKVPSPPTSADISLTAIAKMTKDLKAAGKKISYGEARYLVDGYYQTQEHRIAMYDQASDLEKAGEPNEVMLWFAKQAEDFEGQFHSLLDAFSGSVPLGRWARSNVGVGPVTTAGLLANIDLTKAPVCSSVWRFGGLDPSAVWAKGEKRPWNARLKVIFWKIGESFVKFQNHDGCFYGKEFANRKKQEWEKNLAGFNQGACGTILSSKNWTRDSKTKLWYSGAFSPSQVYAELLKETPDWLGIEPAGSGGQPMLPPAHIHARARRVAVKLFASHYWEVGRRMMGLPTPEPYSIALLGHGHKIEPFM